MITIRHWMQYSAISLEQYQQIQINGICAVGQSTLFLSACTQCSTLTGINLFQLGTPYSVYIIHWWHIPGFCPRGPFTCQTIWSQISCLGILQLSRLQAQVIDRVWQHYRQKIVSVLSQGTRDCSNQCRRLFPSFFERHFKQRWDFHLTVLYDHRKCCIVFKRFDLLGEWISMCMRGYVKSMSVFCMVTLILQVWLCEYLCDAGFSKSLVSFASKMWRKNKLTFEH